MLEFLQDVDALLIVGQKFQVLVGDCQSEIRDSLLEDLFAMDNRILLMDVRQACSLLVRFKEFAYLVVQLRIMSTRERVKPFGQSLLSA